MPGRNRSWADLLLATSVAAGTVSKFDLLAAAPTSDTLTVIRIVGSLQLIGSITSENEYVQFVDVGIGVSSVEAFAVAAAAALPDPRTQTEYPPRGWLYLDRQRADQTVPGGGTAGGVSRTLATFQFDLRAMRKIDKGTLFMVISNVDNSGTSTALVLSGRVRALCLT